MESTSALHVEHHRLGGACEESDGVAASSPVAIRTVSFMEVAIHSAWGPSRSVVS
jgi:hypothetical protein